MVKPAPAAPIPPRPRSIVRAQSVVAPSMQVEITWEHDETNVVFRVEGSADLQNWVLLTQFSGVTSLRLPLSVQSLGQFYRIEAYGPIP